MKYNRMVKEIDELLKLYNEFVNLQCSDIGCMLKKAKMYVELKKMVDRLLHQLAFIYTGYPSEEERMFIEELTGSLIESKLITQRQWELAILHTIGFRRRLNGEKVERTIIRGIEVRDEGGDE
ncbi:MAG: hypothetical protein QXM53_06730 [Thermofilaceae archaeon]